MLAGIIQHKVMYKRNACVTLMNLVLQVILLQKESRKLKWVYV